MHQARQLFDENLERVELCHGLYISISEAVTAAVDTSDLLRSELVQIVSALDHFIHELVLLGMLEIFRGQRVPSRQFGSFKVSTAFVLNYTASGDVSGFEYEVREQHSFKSFQKPDKIAEAVRLFSDVELWNEVGAILARDPRAIKRELALIADRRDKIAHEADLDPTFPGQRWPISAHEIEAALSFTRNTGHAIYDAVT